MKNIIFNVPIVTTAEAGGLLQYYSKIYGIGIGAAVLANNAAEGARDGRNTYDVPDNGQKPDEADIQSSLLSGIGVMFPLTFKGGRYRDLQGATYNFDDVLFESVVCSLSISKNLVETPVMGRNGDVTEMIGLNNWNVEVRAIIPSKYYGQYPAQDVAAFWRMIQAPIAIPVDSRYLRYFDINYLIVKSAQLEHIPGEYSHQRVVLSCKADKPLILKFA